MQPCKSIVTLISSTNPTPNPSPKSNTRKKGYSKTQTSTVVTHTLESYTSTPDVDHALVHKREEFKLTG